MSTFDARRQAMVTNQLRPSGVVDEAVLAALAAIPREAFLPKSLKSVAYADEDIMLGDGRFLIEPLALGRLLQSLAIQPGQVALVIDGGVGYAAAVAAKLAGTAIALAADEEESGKVARALDALGADNAVVLRAEPREGHASEAPFDRILVAGGVEIGLTRLEAQLEPEGGRLAAIRRIGRRGRIELVDRRAGAFARSSPFDAQTPTLRGFDGAAAFVF